MEKNQIRNFAIIAHVDHGKSTLADRFLERTGTVNKRMMQNQFLDSNPISRERGITIKLAPVKLSYTLNAIPYTLNLIDTPGHVDFSYEVSRSLSACEGAILLVDATQGIQAQTLAHGKLAQKLNLKIIPVINKIDLPNANIEAVTNDLINIFGFHKDEIMTVSAKTGKGVNEILKKVIEVIPPPKGNEMAVLRALVFDSVFDEHQGVIAYIRIVDGEIDKEFLEKKRLKFLATGITSGLIDIGYFKPERVSSEILYCGDVGFVATGIKDSSLVRIGDTVTSFDKDKNDTLGISSLPGYLELKPMVFFGFFPKTGSEFVKLGDALSKLHLNDSSFTFTPESSKALGNGYRLGFLGILHGEIIKERLFREFGLDLIATIPNVEYQCLVNNKILHIKNVQEIPDFYEKLLEPWMKIMIFSPVSYVGVIMTLCQEKRAKLIDLVYLLGGQAQLMFEMPLSEMIINFYDRLKSVSSGFANLDYDFTGYKEFDGDKLSVLINQESIDALSFITPVEKSFHEAQRIAGKLKSVIPRQQYEVRIQVADHGRILASETVSPFRKDVIQKLYGGDRTRKDKLLDAQKRGKKKMKQIGKIDLPDEVFVSLYKIS